MSYRRSRKNSNVSSFVFALVAIMGMAATAFGAVTLVTQTPLPGSAIPQFIDPLPGLGDMDLIVDDGTQIVLQMREFQAPVMPSAFVPATGPGTYSGTWVWGYLRPLEVGRTSFIGPVIVATRGSPTEIRWVNMLGNSATTNVLAYSQSTDQTLHWADPLNDMCMGAAPTGVCAEHYDGPIPDVVHLHGGEVPAEIDGGPDAWFTSDGSYHGGAYYAGLGGGGNATVDRYPNSQEAAPLWFHPHPLGVTRLNVYAGLAGAYLLTDPGYDPENLPELVPLVIQDRMFDTNGQLYFPNVGINPEHPFWVPEFVGDTIVVNGKVWPFKNVDQKRYNFLFLNGSNARTYEMFLTDPVTGAPGPPLWVIATDGGYLDAPVKIDPALGQKLVMMPGERYEVIVDFADTTNNPNPSGTYILRNVGRTPYPKGAPPNGSTTGRILMFRVQPGAVADASYNPASGGALRTPIYRLANPATGTLAAGVTIQKTRQLTLNEVIGAGGPLEVLVNNTKYNGRIGGGGAPVSGSVTDGLSPAQNYVTERPQEGETEVWEIVNLTADAHPIHLHLVQYQLMSRQMFNVKKYAKIYNAAFTGGVFIPAAGPPLDYLTGNTRALGGNPDIVPYLQGNPRPPLPQEAGWKDTVISYPGEVTRFVVRWAPTDLPPSTPPANAFYPFDPSGADYVWHCHILDHEDNEMMRPTMVVPNSNATSPRAYVKGVDY